MISATRRAEQRPDNGIQDLDVTNIIAGQNASRTIFTEVVPGFFSPTSEPQWDMYAYNAPELLLNNG